MESTFFTQAQLPSERRCSCQVTDRRIPLLWLSLAVQNSGWVLRPVLTVVVLIATQVNFDVHEKDGSNSAFVVVLGCDLMVSLVPSSVSTEPCCVDGRCRQYCCTGIYPKKNCSSGTKRMIRDRIVTAATGILAFRAHVYASTRCA